MQCRHARRHEPPPPHPHSLCHRFRLHFVVYPPQVHCGNSVSFGGVDRETLLSLSKLTRTAQELTDELGCDVLFLVYHFIEWTTPSSGKTLLSPLLIMPVDILTDVERGLLTIKPKEAEMTVNPTLREKWLQEVQSELPEPSAPSRSGTAAEWSSAHSALGSAASASWALSDYIQRISDTDTWAPASTHARLVSEVWLGTFNSSNFVVYQHIEQKKRALLAHPLVGPVIDRAIAVADAPPWLVRQHAGVRHGGMTPCRALSLWIDACAH